MPKTAYSYIRFSSGKQSKGDSFRRQTEASAAIVQREGWTLDRRSLEDLGVSAFKGKNVSEGALGGFIVAVKKGTVRAGSVLIVESLDRISRDEIGNALSLFIDLLNRGIDIFTLTPERHYTRKSINDVASILEPIVYMSRAHEESKTKSERGKQAKEISRKEASQNKKPMSTACPFWIRMTVDRRGYVLIPEHAATVRRIFKMAASGVSIYGIARQLNQEGIKYVSRFVKEGEEGGWDRRAIQRVLGNRAAIGEFQPMRFVDGAGSKRVPAGEPIRDYFPAVVSETVFEKIGSKVKSRCNQRGPVGKSVANLFTGLLKDARSGCSMTLVNKGTAAPGPRLVSSLAYRGGLLDGKKVEYISISYNDVEAMILHFLFETDVSDLLPVRPESSELRDRLDEEEGRLAVIKRKQKTIEAALVENDDVGSLINVARQVETNRKQTEGRIEQLKSDLHAASENHPITDLQSFKKTFFTATGEERITLRLKVRSLLQRVVKEIWVLPYVDECNGRTAHVQIVFCDEHAKNFAPMFNLGTVGRGKPKSIGGDFARMASLFKLPDLRTWRTLPAKKQIVA